jgi:hypothetical protein
MSEVWFKCITQLQIRTGGNIGVDLSALANTVTAQGKELAQQASAIEQLDSEYNATAPAGIILRALMDRLLFLEVQAQAMVAPVARRSENELPEAVPVTPVCARDIPEAVLPVQTVLRIGSDGTLKSGLELLDGSGSSAATLSNAPSPGDPSKWIMIDDGGTTRYIPAWGN